MKPQPDRFGTRGISLIELLVVTAIVTCLAWTAMTGLGRARSSSRNVQCMSNLRQIHQAMTLYSMDYQSYPYPDEDHTLKDLLEPWLGKSPIVFHCPEDANPNGDSYSYYYAPRSLQTEADNYLLGCSLHQQSTRGAVLYAGANTFSPRTGAILHDNLPARPGEEFDCGTFQFPDGSDAFISMGNGTPTPNINQAMAFAAQKEDDDQSPSNSSKPLVSTLLSIQRDNGTWYTVVKLKPGTHGKVNFSVVPGNRFDVVTETGVIAVRGTVFSVETLKQGGKPATQVDVASGVVEVESAKGGKAIKLDPTPGKNRAIVVQGESPSYN